MTSGLIKWVYWLNLSKIPLWIHSPLPLADFTRELTILSISFHYFIPKILFLIKQGIRGKPWHHRRFLGVLLISWSYNIILASFYTLLGSHKSNSSSHMQQIWPNLDIYTRNSKRNTIHYFIVKKVKSAFVLFVPLSPPLDFPRFEWFGQCPYLNYIFTSNSVLTSGFGSLCQGIYGRPYRGSHR